MNKNLLANETSPYLLQHRDNPVNWQPWNPATLRLAKDSGKPILLSIGYASCHWCHVMAHESFENHDIARLMNQLFINIKVDREERPDLDAIYQKALALMGEQGGWPLTMFLTPDGFPFWGGTYIPPTPRYGRPGFSNLLKVVSDTYHTKPDALLENASLMRQILTEPSPPANDDRLSIGHFDRMALALVENADPINGGFRGAPKFPTPPAFEFLWNAFIRTRNARLEKAVIATLDGISAGGIYDHVAGGFSRYATDEAWLIPHFEKMLYDNAQIIDLLGRVWLETGNHIYSERIRETILWCLRDMSVDDENGGDFAFASGFDADSDGEEGSFYVWTKSQIAAELGDDAELFIKAYGVTAGGNWQGNNILHRNLNSPSEDDTTESRLARNRETLRKVREKRPWPNRDDKVLADWNGLMIAALVHAGSIFREPEWISVARSIFSFIQKNMTLNDRLCHSLCNGKKGKLAFIDDYAAMSRAALALFEATGNKTYLVQAENWVDTANRFYWDHSGGGYFFSASDADDLIIRTKTAADGASPSGNGLMMNVLADLYHRTGNESYWQRGEQLVGAFIGEIHQNNAFMPCLFNGYELMQRAVSVTISGDPLDPRFKALLGTVFDSPVANRILSQVHCVDTPPTAQVCVNGTCRPPLGDADALRQELNAIQDSANRRAIRS